MQTTQRLAGRTAIVTGSGGAIGGAIAKLYAQHGAAVVVSDLDPASARKVAHEIVDAGARAISCQTDVSCADDAERTVDTALSHFGKLDTLVNAAGTAAADATVVDLSLDDWNRVLAINLTGVFLMCKYAIPHITAAGGGVIVNIASQLGQMAIAGRAPYCTSKAALLHLTRALAIDHARDHIRVNSLSPGAVNTSLSLQRFGGDVATADKVRGPLYLLGRSGSVEEVANGALFLASDEASFMTAADLLIDGGYLAFKS